MEARIILTLSKTVTITYSPSTTKFLCFIKWALRRNIIKWTIYEIFELKQSYVEILYVSLYNRLIYICMSVLMVWIFSDYFCLSAWFYCVASVASNLVSKTSKPSAGASWQRPAVGRPISASLSSTNIDTGILNHTDTEIAYQ